MRSIVAIAVAVAVALATGAPIAAKECERACCLHKHVRAHDDGLARIARTCCELRRAPAHASAAPIARLADAPNTVAVVASAPAVARQAGAPPVHARPVAALAQAPPRRTRRLLI